MQLKVNIDIIAFINEVKKCKGSVIFTTSEGDTLNLKSTLSQFVFASLISNTDKLHKGIVVCNDESDYILLFSFFADNN